MDWDDLKATLALPYAVAALERDGVDLARLALAGKALVEAVRALDGPVTFKEYPALQRAKVAALAAWDEIEGKLQ